MAYYDYIRVYGMSSSSLEVFQGLGAAAMYNAQDDQPLSGGDATATAEAGGSPQTPESEKFPEPLWVAQSNLIEQQNAYLDDIKDTFTKKREEMGDTFDMKSFTESDTFKGLVSAGAKKIIDIITDFIPGKIDDIIVDTLASYAPSAIGWGLVWLKRQFIAGAILCERMKEENSQLLTLSRALETYRLRSQVISQHDGTIQSLLSQIAQVETQLMQEVIPDAVSLTDKEPVIQCPHTGDFILAYSHGKMTKV